MKSSAWVCVRSSGSNRYDEKKSRVWSSAITTMTTPRRKSIESNRGFAAEIITDDESTRVVGLSVDELSLIDLLLHSNRESGIQPIAMPESRRFQNRLKGVLTAGKT